MPGLGASHRLHISRDAFFDPVLVVGHVRKCQVDHFMSQYPIVIQIVSSGVSSDRDQNQSAIPWIGDAVLNAGTVVGTNPESEMRDGEAPVVRRDRGGCRSYPV